ncbi:putative glutamine amidotransferase-like class 1 domain-containing protein 3B, mitochondrial [Macrotis lagotis]|uniref:putative glutamine amidotransferase-like class 1 domain-containing protein 3B, mitochondrial n=1 Tax=Macrotis lagotis TaxID=92651 RepID=UPI003D688274
MLALLCVFQRLGGALLRLPKSVVAAPAGKEEERMSGSGSGEEAEVAVTWSAYPRVFCPATTAAAPMFAVRSLAASRPAFPGRLPRPGGQQLPALAALHGSGRRPAARVAVILSGCGVYDGSEIHEASAILVHLSRGGADVKMYAPDISQMHVIDHTKGQPAENEKRNVLVESSRIARGKITDLSKLSSKDYDAVIFPGGFGVAKNLSTFAVDGKDCKVNKDVEKILRQFHKEGKPIGLCCISPILAAKVLQGTEVTIGHEQEEDGKWPYWETAQAIKALGAKHCVKEVNEAHVDIKNKVVTTPAFMCETALHHIFDGIGVMVQNVLKLAKK